MKQKPHIARAALAASVAVIALSSTPLAAQTASQPVTPPVVVSTPAPAAAPVIPPPNLAPAPTIATQPVPAPTIRLPEVDVTAQRETVPETRTASVSRSTPARTSRAAEAAPTAVASADSASPALPAEAEAAPTLSKTDLAKQRLATKVDGATIAPSGEADGFAAGEEGWLAALAALLGLGVVGGGAYATMRRRKRSAGDGSVAVEPEERIVEPVRPAPAFAAPVRERRAPRPAMVRASAPVGDRKVVPARGNLIDHIDFSRQPGYYQSQVDQAPSPINPFLTYRKRITRARFLDRQLRLAKERRGDSRTFRLSPRPPVRERVLEPA